MTKHGALFAELESEQLERVIAQVPGRAYVLEVGCGTARFSKTLAEKGYRVLATDPSSDMLRVASEKCRELRNISFQQEEGANLSYGDATFDLVFSIRVTNHTESEEYALRMIREMIRVTRPGGLILVEFVNSRRPFRRNLRDVRLSFRQIRELAFDRGCYVETQKGIVVFSHMLLNRIPAALIPLWARIERWSARVLWRWASRSYVLLRKESLW